MHAAEPTGPASTESRVHPLDAGELLEAWSRAARGERLEPTGLGGGGTGEVGALLVRRADASEAVLSRGQDAAALEASASLLERARRAGVPAPAYLEVAQDGDLVLLLQERLPGRPPSRVDDALVEQLLGSLGRLRGLLRGVPAAPVDLYLDRSGPGYCRHRPLAAGDPRTRELLDWVHAVAAADGSQLPADDLVHPDPHPGNVLVDAAGALTGLVDWDAPGRGDLRLGWVVLLFDLRWGRRHDPRYADLGEQSVQELWERLGEVEPSVLRRCWAHLSLRQVDWSLRHHGAPAVEHHLATAAQGRRRFGLG